MPRENCLAGRREIWRSVREWTLELSAMLRLNGMHQAPTRSTPCARHSSRRESSLMTQNTHGLNRQVHMRAATSLTKTERAAASERPRQPCAPAGGRVCRRSARGRTSNRGALCAHAAQSRAGSDPRDLSAKSTFDSCRSRTRRHPATHRRVPRRERWAERAPPRLSWRPQRDESFQESLQLLPPRSMRRLEAVECKTGQEREITLPFRPGLDLYSARHTAGIERHKQRVSRNFSTTVNRWALLKFNANGH